MLYKVKISRKWNGNASSRRKNEPCKIFNCERTCYKLSKWMMWVSRYSGIQVSLVKLKSNEIDLFIRCRKLYPFELFQLIMKHLNINLKIYQEEHNFSKKFQRLLPTVPPKSPTLILPYSFWLREIILFLVFKQQTHTHACKHACADTHHIPRALDPCLLTSHPLLCPLGMYI